MPRPCYMKKGFIIVENKHVKKTYYTVVNTNLKEKPHSHLYTFKQAKLVIHWSIKGQIPKNRYTYHMKNSIKRLRPDIDFSNIKEIDTKSKKKYKKLDDVQVEMASD